MDLENLISDVLIQPIPAIGYILSRRLRTLFPAAGIVEGSIPTFDLTGYARAGLCELVTRSVPHSHIAVQWDGIESGTVRHPLDALFDVEWQGERLQVLIVHWQDGIAGPYHYYLIAKTEELAERFHSAVCAWRTQAPEDYILVFDVGGWVPDQALREAIRNATLGNLVLRGTLKEQILSDLESFFASRELYAEYGVPWKRGVLFVGPAGNGKTHAVKAMINALGQRCLYVKSFSGHGPDQNGIRLVFQQARSISPCILVFEDLDSMITADNRSYFLNELDGFAGNDGILTLATTNHPDRLDPAILDRPSRFDRKYPFDLPSPEERMIYVRQWNQSLRPALRLSDEAIEQTARTTDGFSFAYLKELFLSATMRWIAAPTPGTMDAIMTEQVPLLRQQMASVIELPSDPGYGGQIMAQPQPGHMHIRRGLRRPTSGPPG